MSKADIRALQAFLKDFFPLWETVNGVDRLVFISPHVIAKYRELSKVPLTS